MDVDEANHIYSYTRITFKYIDIKKWLEMVPDGSITTDRKRDKICNNMEANQNIESET